MLSFGAVYYAVQSDSYFESVEEILKCDHSNEQYLTVLMFNLHYSALLSITSQCGILMCDY